MSDSDSSDNHSTSPNSDSDISSQSEIDSPIHSSSDNESQHDDNNTSDPKESYLAQGGIGEARYYGSDQKASNTRLGAVGDRGLSTFTNNRMMENISNKLLKNTPAEYTETYLEEIIETYSDYLLDNDTPILLEKVHQCIPKESHYLNFNIVLFVCAYIVKKSKDYKDSKKFNDWYDRLSGVVVREVSTFTKYDLIKYLTLLESDKSI